jgi:hypothetical protein
MPSEHSSAGDPARTLELLWRESGPADSRRGPRQGLSVERVAAAAIALADSDGLGSVTMRAVAHALGGGVDVAVHLRARQGRTTPRQPAGVANIKAVAGSLAGWARGAGRRIPTMGLLFRPARVRVSEEHAGGAVFADVWLGAYWRGSASTS